MKRWLCLPLLAIGLTQCGGSSPDPIGKAGQAVKRAEEVVLTTADLATYRVRALGDVEGNLGKYKTHHVQSDILLGDPDGPIDQITLKDGVGTFVYLGDTIDGGKQNIKFLELLISLKRRYPHRVVLLIGNRDINKLRLIEELDDEALKLDDPSTMYRLTGFRIQNWDEKFDAFMNPADPAKRPLFNGTPTEYTHGKNPASDAVLKARFLLANTFGAPALFENLKTELAAIKGAACTDEEVVAYLKGLARPEGLLGQYLSLAQVMYYDKHTESLFVHGGIPANGPGIIPGREAIAIRDNANLLEWIAELEKWAHDRIADAHAGRFAEAMPLIAFQEPMVQEKAGKTSWQGPLGDDLPNPNSVITARPWSGDNNAVMLPPAVQQQLLKAGVRRLVFGHSPIGEVPLYMRLQLPEGAFEMIGADTSYARIANNGAVSISPNETRIFATFNEYEVPPPAVAGAPAAPPPPAKIAKQIPLLYTSRDPHLGTSKLVATEAEPTKQDRVQWVLGSPRSTDGAAKSAPLMVHYYKDGRANLPTYSFGRTR